VLFRHPVDLRGGRFPHPAFPELLHVRAAVADLLAADGERENPVRAVALQRAGADLKVLAYLRILHPLVRFPAVLLILSLLLFRLPLPGFLHVCRYPVYLFHEDGKGFAFDSYYFHNLLIFRFLVANVPLFDGFSFHVRTTLPKIFSGHEKSRRRAFFSVLPAAASRLSLVRV
jgi:hypothetical protein